MVQPRCSVRDGHVSVMADFRLCAAVYSDYKCGRLIRSIKDYIFVKLYGKQKSIQLNPI